MAEDSLRRYTSCIRRKKVNCDEVPETTGITFMNLKYSTYANITVYTLMNNIEFHGQNYQIEHRHRI